MLTESSYLDVPDSMSISTGLDWVQVQVHHHHPAISRMDESAGK